MGKYKTLFLGFVVGIAAIFIIRSCNMAPTEAHANPLPAAPGKYQISTTGVGGGDGHIFVTVLNTETGQIVKRLKYKTSHYEAYRILGE